MLTRRLTSPCFCQFPCLYGGLLLRLLIAPDDRLMREASHRLTLLCPSAYNSSIHASFASSRASRKSWELGGSNVIGRAAPRTATRSLLAGGT